MVKEALGDLYTEHVKITVKSKSDSAFVFNNEHSDMKTFKQTYFGATNKSQSFDERLLDNVNKSDDNESILPEDEGRRQFFEFC